MKKPLAVALLLAWAILPAQSAFAAENAPERPAATLKSAPAPRAQGPYRASKIVGADVRDQHDRKIGKIEDLILGSSRGDIAYAVVSFGGVLGVGNRYHAIPWQALQPNEDGGYYVLHADRETLNQAPGFDRGKWPDMADRSWRADVDRYWSRRVGRGLADSNRLPPDAAGAEAGSGSSGR